MFKVILCELAILALTDIKTDNVIPLVFVGIALCVQLGIEFNRMEGRV